MEHIGFPDDETLAAFVDGCLDSRGDRRVIEHLVACDECHAVWLAVTESRRGAGAPCCQIAGSAARALLRVVQ
jgi:anti-sigma factor RsiW